MKKLFTIILVLSTIISKAQFFRSTDYVGAFGLQATSSNWASGWTNFDPDNTIYPATNITVSADITTNTTWSSTSVVLLQNKIYVKSGATLTIQAGCIIRGDFATQGTLIVSKGSQLIANGTATNPIIFTTNKAVGSRNKGDWGGIVLLGNAPMNLGSANIEGLVPATDNEYGGSNPTDNSGSLKYIRIEFAGVPYQPNKEINGITFGGVGSATVVSYIQVSYCNDDSYEWFGGTVNCDHLIAYRGLDDDFDVDFGYQGKVQFGLAIRDPQIADNPSVSTSEGFECDNGPANSMAFPRTNAVFSNFTSVGPHRNSDFVATIAAGYRRAVRIRNNTSITIANSVFVNWSDGVLFDGPNATDNYTTTATASDSFAFFGNNIMVDMKQNPFAVTSNASTLLTVATYNTANNNNTSTLSNAKFANAFPADGLDPITGFLIPGITVQPDFRLLNNTSSLYNVQSFVSPKFGSVINKRLTLNNTEAGLNVYPNPTEGFVNIDLDVNTTENANVKVMSIFGKVVLEESLKQLSNGYKLDISKLNTGLYMLNVTVGEKNYTTKILKK